ncbi:MAG: FkbM family methyltransferase [Methanobrevibacter sp.]|jgi:FkbM family methyltransferase|nr:FkbM family methyltransferase [Methanobrevibacter sp.]
MNFREFILGLGVTIKEIKNWPKALLFRGGVFDSIECNYKKLGKVKLFRNDRNIFDTILASLRCDLNIHQINILKSIISQKDKDIIEIQINNEESIKFNNNDNIIGFIFEIFVRNVYDIDNTSEKRTVVDIGANEADTALFFASKGYDVVSFEPISYVYENGKANIDLNENLRSKIKFINKGISCKNGKTKIYFGEDLDKYSGDATIYNSTKNSEWIDVITLDTAMKDYNIIPDVLKMDCEGCEVDIILNSDLSMFNEIYFEYHTIFPKIDENILIKELENQGFIMKYKNSIVKDLGIIKMIKNKL